MPTPAEQKALGFVALVVLLGGAVRVVRGGVPGSESPTPAEQQALARQAFAASSASTAQSARRSLKKPKLSPRRRHDGAKFDSTGVLIGAGMTPTGFPPPSPRIDIGPPALTAAPTPPRGTQPAPLDVDRADSAALERLPGVGPALARRILASRDSLGPFGSLAGLGRVKGMGPATRRRLAPLVTFSGQARR